MKRLWFAVLGIALSVSSPAFGQASTSKDQSSSQDTKERARNAVKDTDLTYGRIKELTPAQKVVIDVDNAPDKTFDLASKDVTVHLASGLKVGDPVQVREHEVAGKTKSVTISKNTNPNVKHGDKDTKAK